MPIPFDGADHSVDAAIRYTASLRFYALISSSPPDTDAARIADLAITLSLRSTRVARSSAFLTRNSWRDARKLYYRRCRRMITTDWSEQGAVGKALAIGAVPAAVDMRTPLDELIARDLEEAIRREVQNQLGSRGEAVLDHLLAGLSTAESAKSVGLPLRTLERWRSRVRHVASVIAEVPKR